MCLLWRSVGEGTSQKSGASADGGDERGFDDPAAVEGGDLFHESAGVGGGAFDAFGVAEVRPAGTAVVGAGGEGDVAIEAVDEVAKQEAGVSG
jgi:hypothetical protein